MLRRPGYVALLVIGAVLLTGIGYGASAIHAIRFDGVIIDAGSLREGQQARASFRFRNFGRSTAAVVNVKPGCGVRAALVRGRTLAAGEDGEVDVRIDTSGLEGVLAGAVAVTLKDPLERTIVLTLKAVVEREFLVESPMVEFGTIAREASAQRELGIRLNNTRHGVLNARSTDENFDVYVESDRAGVATLRVKVREQSQPGVKFGTIRIATSSPNMPQLIVPVRAVVALEAYNH